MTPGVLVALPDIQASIPLSMICTRVTKLIYLLPYSVHLFCRPEVCGMNCKLFCCHAILAWNCWKVWMWCSLWWHLFCSPVCGINCKLFCCHVMSGMKLLQSLNVLCVVPCDESVVVNGSQWWLRSSLIVRTWKLQTNLVRLLSEQSSLVGHPSAVWDNHSFGITCLD